MNEFVVEMRFIDVVECFPFGMFDRLEGRRLGPPCASYLSRAASCEKRKQCLLNSLRSVILVGSTHAVKS
jgi:hypothetical protein